MQLHVVRAGLARDLLTFFKSSRARPAPTTRSACECGVAEEQAESFQFIFFAFLMALLLMFVLLVTQFNSFYQAFLILTAVVMSTAGVLLGLLIAIIWLRLKRRTG